MSEADDIAPAASRGPTPSPDEPREVRPFELDKTGYERDKDLADFRATPVESGTTTAEEVAEEYGDLIPKEDSVPGPADSPRSSSSASSLPVLERIVSVEEATGIFKETSPG